MNPTSRTDAQLVGDTLAGGRDAFAEIVSRYQTLVCSLAYSATGDLTRSEDLAQDTFLAVWRQLSGLREPQKLRAWICGIARNRIQDSIRNQYREPTHNAEALEKVAGAAATEGVPSDHAMSKDEAAIVWHALEQIPESYREPLILFHRENRSVEQVAALLELSEDAVKQRLVRGRKLLQAEVESLVEETLRRTTPTPVFTANVMAALPIAGAATAKIAMGTAAAGAKAVSGIGTVVTAAALLFERKRMVRYEAGAVSLDEREVLAAHRRLVMRLFFAAAVITVIWGNWFKRLDHPVWFAALIPVLTIVPIFIGIAARVATTRGELARIWMRRGNAPVRSWEYRTRLRLFGQPLVHVRIGFNPQWIGADRPVKAWIAVGRVAYGALFAFGQIAVAPISFGAFAVGFLSVGFFAVGALAAGALLGAGVYAVGFVSVGWMASGIIALGINAAHGFNAYAWNFASSATGPKAWAAYARHANDAAVQEFMAASDFFSRTRPLFQADRRTAATLFLEAWPLALWEIAWEIMKARRKSGPAR